MDMIKEYESESPTSEENDDILGPESRELDAPSVRRVLKANFPPQPHDSTPSPPNNVGFRVFFPKQH